MYVDPGVASAVAAMANETEKKKDIQVIHPSLIPIYKLPIFVFGRD